MKKGPKQQCRIEISDPGNPRSESCHIIETTNEAEGEAVTRINLQQQLLYYYYSITIIIILQQLLLFYILIIQSGNHICLFVNLVICSFLKNHKLK